MSQTQIPLIPDVRPAQNLSGDLPLELVGELTRGEWESSAPVPASPLAKIRDSHHRLAHLLAKGVRVVEAAYITGYSPGRIHCLKADPAFQELLSAYRDKITGLRDVVNQRMQTLSMDALQVVQERLDENPDQFTVKELISLAEATLDRTGHAKVTRVENFTASLTSEDLIELRRAASENIKEMQVIDQKDQEELPTHQGDREASMGEARGPAAESDVREAEALRSESERHRVREESRAVAAPEPARRERSRTDSERAMVQLQRLARIGVGTDGSSDSNTRSNRSSRVQVESDSPGLPPNGGPIRAAFDAAVLASGHYTPSVQVSQDSAKETSDSAGTDKVSPRGESDVALFGSLKEE